MTGNLIDTNVKKYQNKVAFQSQPQATSQYLQQPTGQVDTTPQADTFGEGKKSSGNGKVFAILGTWLGMNKLMDKFNDHCSKDNYDKTIMSKLGNFGDRMTAKYGNKPIVVSTKAAFNTVKSSLKNFIDSKPILSTMFNTPTRPENSNVVNFLETQQEADLKSAASIIDDYINAKDMPKTLKEAGATKAEIQALQAKYGKGLFGGVKNLKKALLDLEFTRLGAPANYIDTLPKDKIAETLKNMKISHLGLDPATYQQVLKEPHKFETIIIDACKKGGKYAKTVKGRYSWIPFLGLFTKRSTNLASSYNKLITGTKHTSALGKALAKAPKVFMRGLTFGGGKLNTLFISLGLGTAVYNTIKAPAKQKVGTAVGGTVDAVSWIAAMPLAIKAMHAVSGLQYLGTDKASVEKFRKALKIFNKNVANGVYKNEAAYNKAWNAIQKIKAPKAPLNKMQTVLSKLGHFIGIALENPKPFQEATKGLKGSAKMSAIGRNLKRMLPLLGKNAIAYPLRFALYMVVFEPMVNKIISSMTSAIFGKPYEEPEEEEKEAEGKNGVKPEINSQQTQPQQKPQAVNTPQAEQTSWNVEDLPDDNLIKRTVHGEKIMNDPPYIPSENCEIEGIVSPYDDPSRTYIPSDECKVTSSYASDKSKVDEAIARADKAEINAMNFLNGLG